MLAEGRRFGCAGRLKDVDVHTAAGLGGLVRPTLPTLSEAWRQP